VATISPVQTNQGSLTAVTSWSVSLGSGTTAGNTVVIFLNTSTSISGPSGFTLLGPSALAAPNLYCYAKTAVAAETSWSFSTASTNVAWFAVELEGVDNLSMVDVFAPASFQNTATGATSIASGTTGTSSTYDGQAWAIFGASTTGTTPATFSGYTNGFTEWAEQGTSAATSISLAVATLDIASLGTWSTTATASASSNLAGMILVINATGAKKAADVLVCTGFGFNTTAGLTTGVTGTGGSVVFDAVTGSPSITGGELVLSSSSAAESVQWSSPGVIAPSGSNTYLIIRLSVTTPASLPGSDVDLLFLDNFPDLTLWYRAATAKFGVGFVGGTEQASAITVTAATRYEIDLVLDGRTTAYKADWRIDGVAQTQATVTGTVAGVAAIRIGRSVSVGAQFKFDDVVVSRTPGHYPLGDFDVVMLGPDPAGTVTVSGSTSNFNTFTANGTMAAWNATTARDAVDDWPPTIGASADGFAAVTSSATDYVEVPMNTYNASGTGSIRGVRVLMPMWAASATTATCRVSGYDGSASTTLFAEADPNADNSTTTPAWIAKMWKPAGGWTQAKLDAAAIRFGSNDATPDIGPHAVGMEVAVQNSTTMRLVSAVDDTFTVDGRMDPLTGGVLGFEATAPAGTRGATLEYIKSGSTISRTVNPNSTYSDAVDAPDAPTIERITFAPDPIE
jgi:hypothetical protein